MYIIKNKLRQKRNQINKYKEILKLNQQLCLDPRKNVKKRYFN